MLIGGEAWRGVGGGDGGGSGCRKRKRCDGVSGGADSTSVFRSSGWPRPALPTIFCTSTNCCREIVHIHSLSVCVSTDCNGMCMRAWLPGGGTCGEAAGRASRPIYYSCDDGTLSAATVQHSSVETVYLFEKGFMWIDLGRV